MTTLILDCDRSLASIGGDVGVEQTLGVRPVPITNGLKDVRRVLAQLFIEQPVQTGHPLLGANHIETRIVPNAAAQAMGLEVVVLDTASTLADQEFVEALALLNARRAAKNDPPVESLDQSTWGPYGNSLLKLYESLKTTNVVVVVTCHQKKVVDESGYISYEPQIMGSSGLKMLAKFDAVVFATVREVPVSDAHPTGREYVWRTKASEAYPAKTRGLDLPAFVPQNLRALVQRFRVAGTRFPKILIIGESGSGKTTSIATLAKPSTVAGDGATEPVAAPDAA